MLIARIFFLWKKHIWETNETNIYKIESEYWVVFIHDSEPLFADTC